MSAQIVITNPAHPERGTVHLDNNGYIYWETGNGQAPPSPAVLAATIAAVLAGQAPATADRTRDG